MIRGVLDAALVQSATSLCAQYAMSSTDSECLSDRRYLLVVWCYQALEELRGKFEWKVVPAGSILPKGALHARSPVLT